MIHMAPTQGPHRTHGRHTQNPHKTDRKPTKGPHRTRTGPTRGYLGPTRDIQEAHIGVHMGHDGLNQPHPWFPVENGDLSISPRKFLAPELFGKVTT